MYEQKKKWGRYRRRRRIGRRRRKSTRREKSRGRRTYDKEEVGIS